MPFAGGRRRRHRGCYNRRVANAQPPNASVPPDLSHDEEFHTKVRGWVKQIEQRTAYHTLELPNGQVIPGILSPDVLRARLDALEVPHTAMGKRVLDVGAASGWNSFELERRGASVVAVDCVDYPEFSLAQTALGSHVEYRILDVEELTADTVGLFDYTLFLGVLYHLRHPLLGLERICEVTRETAFVESFVTDSLEAPSDKRSLDFYEADELGGQIDNWFGPTTQCLLAFCRSAGFAEVRLLYSAGGRAGVKCSRKWARAEGKPSQPAPRLIAAVNNRSDDHFFHMNRDEYVCAYFRHDTPVTRQSIRVEVDGLGVPALAVANSSSFEWQVNFRLPPGLALGSHAVRLRTADSEYSNEFEILQVGTKDRTRPEFEAASLITDPAPEIFRLQNTATGGRQFFGHRGERLACMMRTPAGQLHTGNTLLQCDERDTPIELIISHGNQEWQINSKLPPSSAPAHTGFACEHPPAPSAPKKLSRCSSRCRHVYAVVVLNPVPRQRHSWSGCHTSMLHVESGNLVALDAIVHGFRGTVRAARQINPAMQQIRLVGGVVAPRPGSVPRASVAIEPEQPVAGYDVPRANQKDPAITRAVDQIPGDRYIDGICVGIGIVEHDAVVPVRISVWRFAADAGVVAHFAIVKSVKIDAFAVDLFEPVTGVNRQIHIARRVEGYGYGGSRHIHQRGRISDAAAGVVFDSDARGVAHLYSVACYFFDHVLRHNPVRIPG